MRLAATPGAPPEGELSRAAARLISSSYGRSLPGRVRPCAGLSPAAGRRARDLQEQGVAAAQPADTCAARRLVGAGSPIRRSTGSSRRSRPPIPDLAATVARYDQARAFAAEAQAGLYPQSASARRRPTGNRRPGRCARPARAKLLYREPNGHAPRPATRSTSGARSGTGASRHGAGPGERRRSRDDAAQPAGASWPPIISRCAASMPTPSC